MSRLAKKQRKAMKDSLGKKGKPPKVDTDMNDDFFDDLEAGADDLDGIVVDRKVVKKSVADTEEDLFFDDESFFD